MGYLRSEPLIMLFTALFALSACVGTIEKPPVLVKNLDRPGAVSIVNQGPDITLGRKLIVEKHVGAKWTQVDADVRLINSCSETETGANRVLHRGETLELKAWNGWSCDGQCGRSCRANVYLGPGEFRLVVVSANGKQRFEGPGFMMPAEVNQ